MNKDNKYQEALYKVLYDNPKVELTTSDIHSSIGLLQELIDKYYKLEQENQVLTAISEKAIAQRDSQKEILDMLKNYLDISIDYQGDNSNDLCYLIVFHNSNGKTILEKISKKQYEVLEEWKDENN